MDWTTAAIDRLRALWAEGHSTGKIAKAMGLTKNSIVGKAHRLGLPSRPSPILQKGEPRPERNPKVTLPPVVPEPRVAGRRSVSSDLGSRPVPKQTLEVEASAPEPAPFVRPATRTDKRGCQWPIGEPREPGFRFCEAPEVVFGRPYCPEHQAMSCVTPGHAPYGYARVPKGWAA